MKATMYFTIIILSFLSCTNEAGKGKKEAPVQQTEAKAGDYNAAFTVPADQDTVTKDGESIVRYENGVIRMRGMMKDGKREGLWKSWYEDGKPWSETTFSAGIRNGRTVTWYENGQKRYEGEYKNDLESGSWIYWDEKGKEVGRKDLGKQQP